MTDETLWVHFGIPRTGGGSIRDIIRRYCEINGRSCTDIKSRDEEIPASLDYLILHDPIFPVHEKTDRPCRYFTTIRHPLKSVVSDFFWLQTKKSFLLTGKYEGMPEYLRDFDMDFPAYVDALPDSLNVYCRLLGLLGGHGQALPHLPQFLDDRDFFDDTPQETLLLRAVKVLSEHFAFIGVTEKFNESLFALAEILAWERIPVWGRLNASVRSEGWDDKNIPEPLLAKIYAANAADFALYKQIAGMIRNMEPAIIEKYGQTLAEYKTRCQLADSHHLEKIGRKAISQNENEETLRSALDDGGK